MGFGATVLSPHSANRLSVPESAPQILVLHGSQLSINIQTDKQNVVNSYNGIGIFLNLRWGYIPTDLS